MSTSQIVESLASFLVDTAAKGTVLLLLAVVATLLLRRSSAAMRHAVWSLTIFSRPAEHKCRPVDVEQVSCILKLLTLALSINRTTLYKKMKKYDISFEKQLIEC